MYGFPNFVVMNARGEVIGRWVGYGEPGQWVEKLDEILADPVTAAERKARFEAYPQCSDAMALGNVEFGGGHFREAEGYFRRAMELDPEVARSQDAPIRLFRAAYYGVGEGQFTLEEAWATVEELLSAKDLKTADLFEITDRLASVADRAGVDGVADVLRRVEPRVAGVEDPEFRDEKEQFAISYALLVEKDPEKAVRLKRATLPRGWESDAGTLNSFAWWCFSNRVNLGEAEEMARKAMSISEEGLGQVDIMDTLAQILYLRGDTDGAIQWIEKALALAPQSRYLQRERARFRGEKPA